MRHIAALILLAGTSLASDPLPDKPKGGPGADAQPKTSDLLLISGGRSTYKFREADARPSCGNQLVTEQTIVLRARGAAAVHAQIWSTGIPELSFPGDSGDACCASASDATFREVEVQPNQPAEIRYWICMPNIPSRKAQGTIQIAAEGRPAEPLAVSVETEDGFDTRFLTPVATGLAGATLGAVIGYFGFQLQQRSLRNWARQEKVVAASSQLQAYFSGSEFRDALGSQGDWTAQRLKEFKTSVITNSVYALLPPKEAAEFDRLCKGSANDAQRADFKSLLQRNFPQFLDPDTK